MSKVYVLNYQPTSKIREIVAELEELGYGALWIGKAMYREPLTSAAVLLSATSRMVVATGIANMWAHDPFTMAAAQFTLAEAYPERFLLGLGVSHARLIEGSAVTVRAAIDGDAPLPGRHGRGGRGLPGRQADGAAGQVLAALGPRMLALAAERADGAHPYLVTPQHTAKARPTRTRPLAPPRAGGGA